MTIKPHLACDWNPDKLRFPYLMQPKIDGVRALHLGTNLTGRSLKNHRNIFTTNRFSGHLFAGFDGEMAAEYETHPALCRLTASALSTIEGTPFLLWHVFDYLVPATFHLPYVERQLALRLRVAQIQNEDVTALNHLRIMPSREIHCLSQLEDTDAEYLELGYEGSILRDPNGLFKQGRATVKENALLRLKRFVEDEAVVIHFIEGNTNGNVAQINELGKQFRSSHQEGMIPNGQVGTIVARKLNSEEVIHVGPGEMDATMRKYWWDNRLLAPGKVFTYKHFPKGVKDKPRYPTWKSWRDEVDRSS